MCIYIIIIYIYMCLYAPCLSLFEVVSDSQGKPNSWRFKVSQRLTNYSGDAITNFQLVGSVK